MTELEKLNERITQLTELVKTGSEAIKNMEIALKAAEEERDRLADQRREHEPKFERAVSTYYTFGFDYGVCTTYTTNDQDLNSDIQRYNNNCYFHTRERAQEVADKINLLLKLERLHDIYCPDFKPNWGNNEEHKYHIWYSNDDMRYDYDWYTRHEELSTACFPTREIAQKVCDILNSELKEQERNCNE